MKTLILAILLLETPPQINGWEEITKTHYEVKNGLATSMLGLMQIFKNPAEENEFVFVVSKYPAITFLPPQPQKDGKNSPDEIIIAENYFKKTRQENLNHLASSSDAILFVKWREKKDQRTGEKILEGQIESWLLAPRGRWIFKESEKAAIKIELLSEKEILIGFKFSLEKTYHILRFNQEHLGGAK